MKKKIRWMIRRVIRLWARRRRGGGFQTVLRPPRSIAYFAAGGIGDIVMTWPALKMLRETFPDARLDVFVPPKPYAIIREAFAGFNVCAAPSTRLALGFVRRRYDCAFTNTIAVFSLAVELNAYMASRQCWGFRYPDEPDNGRLFTATLPVADTVHDIDQNCGLVSRAFGAGGAAPVFFYPRPHAAGPSAPVLIHPGAERGYEYKMWPLDRYQDICRRCAAAGHAVTVLLGPDEVHMRRFFEGMPSVDAALSPPPSKLMEIMRTARLFVGNDSGPAHLAAFCGTAGITLIGPVDPKRSAPRGPHCVYIHNAVDCAPCHFKQRQCADNRCMKSITVEQVWREISGLLQHTDEGIQ